MGHNQKIGGAILICAIIIAIVIGLFYILGTAQEKTNPWNPPVCIGEQYPKFSLPLRTSKNGKYIQCASKDGTGCLWPTQTPGPNGCKSPTWDTKTWFTLTCPAWCENLCTVPNCCKDKQYVCDIINKKGNPYVKPYTF